MKNFIRKKENFVCGNCGLAVKGNGYTDHCPKCLWGRHVDEEVPGDRASDCRALMAPIGVRYEQNEFKIHHKCTKCRHEFWVKSADNDDRDELMRMCVLNM